MDTMIEEPKTESRAQVRSDRIRRRRRVAAGLAAAGVAAIAFAAVGPIGSDASPADSSRGGEGRPASGGASAVDGQEPKPPSTAPGGVGMNPAKTGLPAVPAEGGLVRTGTKEQGCFEDVRSYLEEWHRTGVEPDPCFTAQPASDQDQPSNVQRSYNGERF